MTFQISGEKMVLISDVEAHLLDKGEKESCIFASFVSQIGQIDQTFKCKKKKERNLRNPRRKHELKFKILK